MKATLQGLMLTIGALTCFKSAHVAAMDNINTKLLQKISEPLVAAGMGYCMGNTVTNYLENDNSYTKNIPTHNFELYKPTEEEKKNLTKEELNNLIETKTNENYGYTGDKKLNVTDMVKIIDLASKITAHNEKTKTWREGIVTAALALASLQIDKYKYDLTDCEKNTFKEKNSGLGEKAINATVEKVASERSKLYGKDLSSWLTTNFFDFYRSIETVYKKKGYGQTYMTNGSVNWSALGKTSTYLLAAWVQISLPALLHPRLKPLDKVFSRSLINKGLEMIFHNKPEDFTKEALDEKKFNESLKDIFTCSHGLYGAYTFEPKLTALAIK